MSEFLSANAYSLPHWAVLLHWQAAVGSGPAIKGLHHEQSAPVATPD